ncbi:MAG TPA: S53 family peptidase [Streptosporangiaceae bacterium]|jgi:subtilase family serine protease
MHARRIAAAAAAACAVLLGLGCSASAGAGGHQADPAGPGAPPSAASVGKPPAGLTPAQVARAYNLGPLTRRGIDGAHQTIVIVDSFGSPTIARDLAGFDVAFGLRPPPSLGIIQPAGPVPAYRPTSGRTGWAGETTLDVEWAHAMAPAASILLVETPTAENEGRTGFPQIVSAEEYVIRHHLGQVISQSLGATEETFSSPAAIRSLRGAYELAAQPKYAVTMLAASGDSGASGQTYNMRSLYPRPVVEWPATDPLVTAVGATALVLGPAGLPLRPVSVWPETGGGLSSVFPRPAYQDGVKSVAGGHRAIPDISMAGSCETPVAIYASYPGGGQSRWQTICGTSMSTPLFAGIVALADQVAGHSLGLINPALYQMSAAHDPGIVDVTAGTNSITVSKNGSGARVRGFAARPGYDLVSGVGTVNAAYFVPELARLAGHASG